MSTISKKPKLLIIEDDDDDVNETYIIDGPKFTTKEIENYNRQKDKCIFKTPTEEYLWSKTQNKNCSKCSQEKKLCEFNGSTSGTDAFDKIHEQYLKLKSRK